MVEGKDQCEDQYEDHKVSGQSRMETVLRRMLPMIKLVSN